MFATILSINPPIGEKGEKLIGTETDIDDRISQMTECFRGSQATEKQQVGGKRRGTSEWKKKVFRKEGA